MRQVLVLIRSTNNKEAVCCTDYTEDRNIYISITGLTWCVPHIVPNVQEQNRLNSIIAMNTETPLSDTTRHTGILSAGMSTFDHSTLENIRVFLNTERNPYGDLNFGFSNILRNYEMYSNFRESCPHLKNYEPVLNPTTLVNEWLFNLVVLF